MQNPSDFSIATGDVSFNMSSCGANVGSVVLTNLSLIRSPNTVLATAKFDPKSSQVGQDLLSTFVMGKDNTVQILGTNESTFIAPLVGGLSQVSLDSTLPGLTTALIQGSALTVRPTTLVDGVVGVKVSIANPFSAGLTIHKVVSAITYHGVPVGNIDQNISSNPIVIPGKATVQSRDLNMIMNTEPAAIALLLRSLAVTSNLNIRPLDALFTLGGFHNEGQKKNVDTDSSLFTGFNISSFVMDAMKSLKVDLSLASGLTIGKYDNTLTFSQASVQVATDDTITGFDLPTNDAAGGITLVAQTNITNPSQIGFNFDGAGFENYYKGIDLGSLATAGAAVFPPRGTANLTMKGRLVYQDSSAGLAAITEVFENFLGTNSSLLNIKGVYASGPNGAVQWLSNDFKAINIKNVVLPGPPAKPTLITAVNMKDLQMDFTKNNPFAAPAGSHAVEAQLKNPFGFPLGVISLNMKVDANSGGHNVANLDIPQVPATTTPDGIVHTAFENIPFKVYSGAEPIFTQFVAGLTLMPAVPFGLEGVVNSIAQTAVGNLTLNNIPFDVPTSLAGFQSFGGTTEILLLKVVGGYATYIAVDLVVALNNPSQITITVGDLVFDVIMDAAGSSVGAVTLTNAVIKPGRNEMSASMKMTGTDLLALSKMLTNYLIGQTTPLTVKGKAATTKIIPLQPGLAQVALKTNLVGIPASLVVESEMQIVSLVGNPRIWVKFNNSLDTQYTVAAVSANVFFTGAAGVYTNLGALVGAINPPVTVPTHGTAINENYLELKLSNLATAISFLTLPADMKKVDLYQNVSMVLWDAFHGAMYYKQKGVSVVDKDGAATAASLAQALSSNNATATASSVLPSLATSTTIVDAFSTSVDVSSNTVNASSTTTIAEADQPTTTKLFSSSPSPTTTVEATETQPINVVANGAFILPF